MQYRKNEEYISFVYRKSTLYCVFTQYFANVIQSFIRFYIRRRFVKNINIKRKRNNRKNFPIKKLQRNLLNLQKNQMLTYRRYMLIFIVALVPFGRTYLSLKMMISLWRWYLSKKFLSISNKIMYKCTFQNEFFTHTNL